MQGLNWNDICIIGDSFAHYRTDYTDWPKHLVHLLTNEPNDTPEKSRKPRGQGFPGCSWWSTRARLLLELERDPIKVLIICHTEMERLPSKHHIGINFRSVMNGRLWYDKSIPLPVSEHILLDAALKYYEHLSFNDYNEWCYIQWLKELNDIIEKYHIKKVVHLPCFTRNNEIEIKYLKKGLIATTALEKFSNPNNILRNHLDTEKNVRLAQEIYRILQFEQKFGPVDINLN